MQNKTRLELADYEAENLAKLQKLLSKKWELIYMQAEAQIKVDKKRDKMERKILDSQERAFWDVYRPAPGCVNTTENDIRKTMRTRRTDFPNIGFFRYGYNLSPSPQQQQQQSQQQSPSTISSNPIAFINSSAIKPLTDSNNTVSGGGGSGGGTTSSLQPTTSVAASGMMLLAAKQNSAGSSSPTNPASSILAAPPSPLFSQKLSENDEFITVENLKKEREFLKRRLERRYVKTSKVSERYGFFLIFIV
jgi:hypothetical protein